MLPAQVTIRDLSDSPSLKNHLLEKIDKLNELFPRIMGCRVKVDMVQKHKHQGKLFRVKIDITVPNEELTVTKNTDENVFVALREAFDDCRRQLDNYNRQHQHNGKGHLHHKFPGHGYIYRLYYDDGYGFIEAPDGHTVYFNECTLRNAHFGELEVGMPVHYVEEMGEKGPQASRVKLREPWQSAA